MQSVVGVCGMSNKTVQYFNQTIIKSTKSLHKNMKSGSTPEKGGYVKVFFQE